MINIENIHSPIEQIPTNESVELPDVAKDYICEAIKNNNIQATIARIDQCFGEIPPRGIDADPEVKNIIETIKDRIETRFLEAPNDIEQVKTCAERINQIVGTDYRTWSISNYATKVNVLQSIENTVAEVEHRNPCTISLQNMPRNKFGYYDPHTKTIVLNNIYVTGNDLADYTKCIETVLHEGRHAYQDYNLTQRQVHPDEGAIRSWRANEHGYGYLDAETYGFEAYWKQPIEIDARNFSNLVLTELGGKHFHIHESTQADVDYFAKMVRISHGSEQQYWLDRYNWALKHLQ